MDSGAPEPGGRSDAAGHDPHCAHGADVAGRYRIGSLLRADGRCCVHEGRDELLRRRVSVTLATPERGIPIPTTLPLPTSAQYLHGPGLGEIYDGGDDRGTIYLITQAPEGGTLADELSRHHLTAEQTRDLGVGIARALLPAHRRGWAHGALEADTVGLGPDRVTVAGLGVGEWLAHWAHVEDRPRHPAPEQLTDQEISPATDVFALGALLTEAAEPLAPTEPLAGLLARMCAEDPAERPTTEEVLRLLRTPEEATLPPDDEPRVTVVRRRDPDGRTGGRTAPTVEALGGLVVAAAMALATMVVHTSDASPEYIVGGATVAASSADPVLPGPLPLLIPPLAPQAVTRASAREAAVTVERPRTSDVRPAAPSPQRETGDDRSTAAADTSQADTSPTDTTPAPGHDGTTEPARPRATSDPDRVDRSPTTPTGHLGIGAPTTPAGRSGTGDLTSGRSGTGDPTTGRSGTGDLTTGRSGTGDPTTGRSGIGDPTTHRHPTGTATAVPTITTAPTGSVVPTAAVTPSGHPDDAG